MALNARLDDLAGLQIQDCGASKDPSSSASDDFVEKYLCSFFQEDPPNSSSGTTSSDSFLSEILKLESRPKVPITSSSETIPLSSGGVKVREQFDIIRYWKQRKIMNPRMYRIAIALLSIPSTQVTVERLFSQLKLVITDTRTRLNCKSIKNIMFLKSNESLWPKVIDVLEPEVK